jgi:hypothetical protein
MQPFVIFNNKGAIVKILTTNHTSSIGLVRLYVRRLREQVELVKAESARLAQARSPLAKVAKELYSNSKTELNKYFGDDFYDFWIFQFAEFLDGRTFKSFIKDKKLLKQIHEMMGGHFCSEEERLSPKAYFAKYHRRTGDAVVAEADQNDVPDFLRGAGVSPDAHLKDTSPLQDELADYIRMRLASADPIKDPLLFWSQNSDKLPILARIARVILSIPPTQADCERMFSRSGKVSTPQRNALSPDHIDENTTLFYWLQETEERLHRLRDNFKYTEAQLKVIKRYHKYISICIDDELAPRVVELMKADIDADVEDDGDDIADEI